MESRCARARADRARVELQLHRGAGARQARELGAFVRYCVSRIERELGQIEHWSVAIEPSRGEFASRVAVRQASEDLECRGRGMDGPLAVWDALCRVEQQLRESRARRCGDAAATGARRHLAMLDGGRAT